MLAAEVARSEKSPFIGGHNNGKTAIVGGCFGVTKNRRLPEPEQDIKYKNYGSGDQ